MKGLWGMLMATEDAGRYIGAGVIYVDEEGKAFGGDNGSAWWGSVSVRDGGVTGALKVQRFAKGAGSIFMGMENEDFYEVNFSGGYGESEFHASAWAVKAPLMKAAVHLKRIA